MRVSSTAFAVFFAVLAADLPLDAQESLPAFGERVDVEVVNVDVIVTDASGNRVTDLVREDFLLEVDGKVVPIDYFAAPGARPTTPARSAGEPDLPTVDLSRANLFVFVDQSALEWRTSKQILEEIRAFVLPRTGANERIMIAAFAENLRILSPPTADRERIEQAFLELEKLRGRGSLAAAERAMLERDVRENGQPRAQVQIINPDTGEVGEEQALREAGQDQADTENLRLQIESFAEQQLDRQARAVAALREWIGALAAIDGRKSVLFASAGYTSQPDAFLTRYLDQKRGDNPSGGTLSSRLPNARINLLDDFERVVRAAQNARVAFYTVTPREAPSSSFGAEFSGSGAGTTTLAPRDPAIAEAASSLQRLAGATGGDALFLDDGLSERLSMVADDAAAAYSLGFSTGEAAGSGDHVIQVRTQDGDLTVRHRESFRRSSLGERAEAALVAAATFETTVNPLAMQLELGVPEPLDKKGKEALVPILVRIPLALVSLEAAGPDGARRTARLTARVAVLNEARHIRLGESGPIGISIPAAELERALGSFWAYRAEVMVGRGSQRVAVVVTDEIAGTVSTLTATVERGVE
jgi:VWFA-related protein